MGLTLRSLDAGALRASAALLIAGVRAVLGQPVCAQLFGAPRALGVLTPVGGLAWITGWLLFACGVWRH